MPNTPPRLVADGTIYPCRFVKMSAEKDFRGLQAEANDVLIGISYEGGKRPPLSDLVTDNPHAEAGDPIGLLGPGEQGLLELGADATPNTKLKADGDGKGVPIAATGATLQHYGAIALEGGKAGTKIQVIVELGSVRPALV
jgi:hypothetical protein